jgi:hypothetical protein
VLLVIVVLPLLVLRVFTPTEPLVLFQLNDQRRNVAAYKLTNLKAANFETKRSLY